MIIMGSNCKLNQLKYSYDKVEGRGELGGEGVVGS